MIFNEQKRFDTKHPDLCASLRWKGQFIPAEPDPTVPRSNDGNFWCLHTQTCIGPDGKLESPVTALPRAENAMALDSATTSPKSPERSSLNCKRQTSLCASLRPFSFRLSDASINCESNPRQIVRCCSALPSRLLLRENI